MEITILIIFVLNTVLWIATTIITCLNRKRNKKETEIIFKKRKIRNVNLKYYSTPTFDFPNIQSELDLKIINSGTGFEKKRNDYPIRHYCNF